MGGKDMGRQGMGRQAMIRRGTGSRGKEHCVSGRRSHAGAVLTIGLALAAGVLAARALRRPRQAPADMLGKRVLITGGSRGLGFVLAQEFIRRGARVAICARDRLELSRASAIIAEVDGPMRGMQRDHEVSTPRIFALVCDVTEPGAVERMVRTVEQRFGGIDILVNNAGVITLGPLDTMTRDDFEYAMKVHFWGPLVAMLAVLPGMRARGGGSIVNISSIGGRIGVPQLAPYCASKFALQGVSEALHAELRKDGVRVTAICPGIMRTGGQLNSTYKGQHEYGYEWMNAFNLLPGFSIGASRAARRIVDAVARGDGVLVIGAPAKVADKLHSLFPSAFASFEGLAARLLPNAEGGGSIGRAYATGLESEPGVLPCWLKRPLYRTAARHNQFAGMRRTGAGRE